MNFVKIAVAAGALSLAAISAQAATYDFAAGANGAIGESIWSTFNTSDFYSGPNLKVTAGSSGDNDPRQYVYLDAGYGGMGVCKDVLAGAVVNSYTAGSTDNRCNPASDDGITTDDEFLTFTATSSMATRITGIWLNANHDGVTVTEATFRIGGVEYDLADYGPANSKDEVFVALNILLGTNEFFTVSPVRGSPNTYISALSLEVVPVPAAGLLLLGGLGGLAAMKRRKKKAA